VVIGINEECARDAMSNPIEFNVYVAFVSSVSVSLEGQQHCLLTVQWLSFIVHNDMG